MGYTTGKKHFNLSVHSCKPFRNRLRHHREIVTRTWPTINTFMRFVANRKYLVKSFPVETEILSRATWWWILKLVSEVVKNIHFVTIAETAVDIVTALSEGDFVFRIKMPYRSRESRFCSSVIWKLSSSFLKWTISANVFPEARLCSIVLATPLCQSNQSFDIAQKLAPWTYNIAFVSLCQPRKHPPASTYLTINHIRRPTIRCDDYEMPFC